MGEKLAFFVIVLVLGLGAVYYWQQQNEPVNQTPTASLTISLQAGGLGHCQNRDGTKSWKPRADGKCYAADAPSPIADALRQTFDDHPTTVYPVPQVQPLPAPRSLGFCLSTEDIPGLEHQYIYNIREWAPRSDGLCYPQDAPALVTTTVYGDHWHGGPLGCKISFFKIWSPRADGMCWAEDAPK
jgi:hypothetical protein